MAELDIVKIARSLGDAGDGEPRSFVGLQRRVYGFQTLAWLGRLRVHVFHGPDPGEAFHNHPSDFWTFPLRAYVEQVLDPATARVSRQVVPAWWVSYRPAEHAHQILGRWSGEIVAGVPTVRPGKVVTVFWGAPRRRSWEYLIVRAGKVRRLPWRRYLARADKQPANEAGRPDGLVSAPAKITSRSS